MTGTLSTGVGLSSLVHSLFEDPPEPSELSLDTYFPLKTAFKYALFWKEALNSNPNYRSTYCATSNHASRILGKDFNIYDLKIEHLDRLTVQLLLEGKSKYTVNNSLSSVKTTLSFLREEGFDTPDFTFYRLP